MDPLEGNHYLSVFKNSKLGTIARYGPAQKTDPEMLWSKYSGGNRQVYRLVMQAYNELTKVTVTYFIGRKAV
jgi:predicted 3-demethylubiquinone-9 3-methyltransferase (glyoxalase superfamily)